MIFCSTPFFAPLLVCIVNEKWFMYPSMNERPVLCMGTECKPLLAVSVLVTGVSLTNLVEFVLPLLIRFLSYLPSCSTTANFRARLFFHQPVQSTYLQCSLLALTGMNGKTKTHPHITMIKKFSKLLIR